MAESVRSSAFHSRIGDSRLRRGCSSSFLDSAGWIGFHGVNRGKTVYIVCIEKL